MCFQDRSTKPEKLKEIVSCLVPTDSNLPNPWAVAKLWAKAEEKLNGSDGLNASKIQNATENLILIIAVLEHMPQEEQDCQTVAIPDSRNTSQDQPLLATLQKLKGFLSSKFPASVPQSEKVNMTEALIKQERRRLRTFTEYNWNHWRKTIIHPAFVQRVNELERDRMLIQEYREGLARSLRAALQDIDNGFPVSYWSKENPESTIFSVSKPPLHIIASFYESKILFAIDKFNQSWTRRWARNIKHSEDPRPRPKTNKMRQYAINFFKGFAALIVNTLGTITGLTLMHSPPRFLLWKPTFQNTSNRLFQDCSSNAFSSRYQSPSTPSAHA